MACSSAAAAAKVDTLVIGAGVVGLAVARALAKQAGSSEILLVDRAAHIGSETSSRNSEVVHAGLYYPDPDSLKARFCVQGKKQLYQYCEARGIDYRKCGKLVVASQANHLSVLQKLQQQAVNNGVHDTQLLSTADAIVKEPALQGAAEHQLLKGALWSPSTGIVDSHNFMTNLLADAEQSESSSFTLALHTAIDDAQLDNSSSNTRIQLHASGMWLSCRRVVNCAGLWATQIANLIHKNNTTTWKPPQQYFARGTYFRLQQQQSKQMFSHLIYPVPDKAGGGLGVHATLDLQGQVRFGPDVEWLPVHMENPDSIDMKPDPNRAESFYKSIRTTYWPDLPDGALVPDYTGVRPKLQHPSQFPDGTSMPFHDFCIVGPKIHGVPGLVHLFGIESPGLTSSMAIADYVVKLLDEEQHQ